eukprot:GFUD01021202.1.p1 GENE.GFUD01021202.1~~GFUD01021202.1.p1  ORF type:complete len:225 (-),score=73.58 GFUD01021202.1:135-809(-)
MNGAANNERPSVVESEGQEVDRLLAALASLCTRDNTDTTIECEEQKFYCHSVLLKARSQVFFRMLEGGQKQVRIDGTKSSIMDDVIKYLYTGQVSITRDRMVELVTAGDKFELPGLLAKCLEIFRNQINFDNAIDILILADKHGLEDFKKAAINKITFNRTMLMADTSFRVKMMENPAVLLQLYDKLCQANIPVNMTEDSIWQCLCGVSAIGEFCSWCGSSNQA